MCIKDTTTDTSWSHAGVALDTEATHISRYLKSYFITGSNGTKQASRWRGHSVLSTKLPCQVGNYTRLRRQTTMAASQKSAVFKGVEEISEDDCLSIARRKTKCTDVEVVNVTMKPLSDTPAGFAGDHYRLKMTVLQNPKSKEVTKDSDLVDLHFFVKTKPRGLAHLDFVDRWGVVKIELDFFSTLMVLFRKYIGDEKDNGSTMQEPWTADCYLANMKLIVLDDLSQEGYTLMENRATMDYEHCVVTFKTVARFHALTFILEEKESQQRGKPYRLIKEYPDMFKENTWLSEPPGNAGKQICVAGINGLLTITKVMPQLKQDPEKFEIVQKALDTLFTDVEKFVKISTEVRNVASHGDLWANNVMFRYDSTGTKPISSRIIDFQLLRYTAPAHDFICALYLNTTREFRDKHFHKLASVYHSAVAAELAKHGLDVEDLMPWEEFKESLEHYRMLGILVSFVYFPSTLLPEEVASEVFGDPVKLDKFMIDDQSEWTIKSYESDALFRERLHEVADELAEYIIKTRK